MSASRWSTRAGPAVKTATEPDPSGSVGRSSRSTRIRGGSGDRADRVDLVFVAGAAHEGRNEHPVRVETGAHVLLVARDEDRRIRAHRRHGRPAPVEDQDVGRETLRQLDPRRDVRRRDLAGQSSAAPAADDRPHAGEERGLQMVGRRMTTRSGESD